MKQKKTLTKEEIIYLSQLGGLKLTEEEIERYQKQLEETVEYIANLEELNTEKIKPTSHTNNLTNVFFDDGEKNIMALTPEQALKNAKNKKDGYFIVKRII